MVLATLSETAPVVLATCTAGVALLLIGAWFAKKEIAQARGADKIVALTNLCMAIPAGRRRRFAFPGSTREPPCT